jgi:hypothetical protein
MASYGAYCPSCSVTIHRGGTERAAELAATHHATITGHVVQLTDAVLWRVLRSVAGEPSLPLWESES